MSNVKFALVIDRSDAYLGFQRDRILEEWAVDPKTVRYVSSVDQISGGNLFEDSLTSVLTLPDKSDVKDALTKFEIKVKTSPGSLESVLESGVVILTPVSRVSLKSLEKFVANHGGKVILPPGKGEDSTAEKLVSEVNLSPSVRKFVLSYVGDDYDVLIPLVKNLLEIPKKLQPKITEDDICIRLPQPPGSIAPWEIEKPLLTTRNLSEVISISRRVQDHSSILPLIAILKKKFQLSYRIATLLEFDPKMDKSSLAAALGETANYPFTLAMGNAKKYGRSTLESAVLILAEAERNAKGGSSAPSSAMFERSLVRLFNVLR